MTFKDDTRDTQFKGGNKENDPGKWDIIPHPADPPAAVSPDKNQVLAGAIAGELVPTGVAGEDDHVFVYGAFERLPITSSNTTLALELNQLSPTAATATQPKLPQPQRGRHPHQLRRRRRSDDRAHVPLARRRQGRDDRLGLRLVLAARLSDRDVSSTAAATARS